MNVKEVLEQAKCLGACNESAKATDWKSLVWLFFSPQGREFCKDNNYPTIDMFRAIKKHVKPYGIHVEESTFTRNKDVALIGDCGAKSELSFSGVKKAYKVILMHGAKAIIHARQYSVVRIENINGEYEIINDGTAEVLI